MTDDETYGRLCCWLQVARVTMHVREKGSRCVIEYRDKWTRRVVGNVELKRRLGIKK